MEHRQSIDVAIADLKLPDGQGIDLLHEFWSDEPDLSCLVITGDPSFRDGQLKNGRLLAKPFTEAEFISALIEP